MSARQPRPARVARALPPRRRRRSRPCRAWPWRSWSPTARPSCSPTRRPGSSAPRTRAGAGWPPGSSRAWWRAMARRGRRPGPDDRGDRPAHLRRLLRGPRARCGTRSRPRPRPRAASPERAPPASTSARRDRRPARRSRGAPGADRRPVHRRGRRTCTPTAATAAPAGSRAAGRGCDGRPRLTARGRPAREIAGRLAAVRARIAAACAAAGRTRARSRSSRSPRPSRRPTSRLLAELGVRDVGENRDQEAAPKAAECADLAAADLAFRRSAADQQGRAAWSATPTSSTRWTGRGWSRPSGGGASAAGPHADLPGAGQLDGRRSRAPGAARPARRSCRRWPTRSPPRTGLALGGVMAVAPLGAVRGRPFAPARRDAPAQVRAAHPGARDLRGHERRSGGGDRGRRDTLRIGTALLGGRRRYRQVMSDAWHAA